MKNTKPISNNNQTQENKAPTDELRNYYISYSTKDKFLYEYIYINEILKILEDHCLMHDPSEIDKKSMIDNYHTRIYAVLFKIFTLPNKKLIGIDYLEESLYYTIYQMSIIGIENIDDDFIKKHLIEEEIIALGKIYKIFNKKEIEILIETQKLNKNLNKKNAIDPVLLIKKIKNIYESLTVINLKDPDIIHLILDGHMENIK